MTLLRNAILIMQKALNAGGAGLTEDATWGEKTQTALDKRLATDKTIKPTIPSAPAADQQPNLNGIDFKVTPWMDWMKAHIGGSENDSKFDALMARFWKLVGLDYKTIKGVAHAWCALTIEAALESCGYTGTHRADAVSYEKYGTPCGFVFGAIVPIRHVKGSHHVTFFHHWQDEKAKLAACLGGNQGDSLKLSVFNLSGNAHGHDECVSGPRWPTKKT